MSLNAKFLFLEASILSSHGMNIKNIKCTIISAGKFHLNRCQLNSYVNDIVMISDSEGKLKEILNKVVEESKKEGTIVRTCSAWL